MSQTRTCPQCGRTYDSGDRFCTVDGAALVSDAGASLIGTVVADRFLVHRKIADGGMGEVYLAEHVRIKRKVALKVMRPWMIGDPVAVGRFHREAENASQITHPHVAQVYDFGEAAGGMVFLAMEFVDGEPLSAILTREKHLHIVRASEMVRQVAEALVAAHGMGILHRDLKPDNVMVAKSRTGTDIVKLVDFGIARMMNRGTQQFTSTGMVIGTPDYMSPEQLSGDSLDARSDLYALALMAFRMLSGDNAFPGGSLSESMVARLTSRPRRLDAIRPEVDWPEALQKAIERALAPDPAERHADPLEFVAEWDAAIGSMPLGAEEQNYLIALSQRQPTPVRGGPALTPTSGVSPAVQADDPVPMSAVLTPPEFPRTSSFEFPEATVPTAVSAAVTTPIEAPAVTRPVASEPPLPVRRQGPRASWLAVAGLAGIVAVGAWLTRGSKSPQNVAAVAPPPPATQPATPVVAPDSQLLVPIASATREMQPRETVVTAMERATLAVRSGRSSGAAVIVDTVGGNLLALAPAALVRGTSEVDVWVDANTLVRPTVLSVDRGTGLATLLIAGRRCRNCAPLQPDAADPVAGDSVLALPTQGRGDGNARSAAVASIEGRTLTLTDTVRGSLGAPVASRHTGRLIGITGARLIALGALADARALARRQAQGVTVRDSVIPTLPDRAMSGSAVGEAAIKSVEGRLASYLLVAEPVTVLVMTPQVMAWRARKVNDPMNITPDAIGAWPAFSGHVSARRAMVALQAIESEARILEWPSKDVNFRLGDITGIRLFRGDTLVPPVERSSVPSLSKNGSRPITASAIGVWSPADFRPEGTYRLEVTTASGRSLSIPFKVGTLDFVRADTR